MKGKSGWKFLEITVGGHSGRVQVQGQLKDASVSLKWSS